MNSLKHVIALVVCLSLCAPLTQAQAAPDRQQEAQAADTAARDVAIIIQQEKVRFTAPPAVAEMRLQIFDQAGQLVHDSGAVAEPELTWALRQADGEAVRSGLYAYTLSLKEAGAEVARVRRGHLIVDRAAERDGQTDRLWVTSQGEGGVGAELTVARNEGVTIAGTSAAGEPQRARAKDGTANGTEDEAKDKAALAADAFGTAGRIAKFVSATDLGNSVMSEQSGNIGIGTTAPAYKLDVAGALRAASNLANQIIVQTTGGTNAFAQFRMQTPAQQWGVGTSQNYNGNQFYLIDNTYSQIRMAVQPNGGEVTFPGPASNHVTVHSSGGTNAWAQFRMQTTNQSWAIGTSQNYNGDQLYFFDVSRNQIPMAIQTNGNVGIGTTNPQAKLDVAGRTRTGSLEIIGGADFSENFDVNVTGTAGEAVTTKVEAGMVVSIDPENPGKLVLSTQAYDSQVAGIISGAGGVNPGMILSQEGTLADGQHPVALSGRVYCWADASNGPIKPGDLLTTSPTPGHAMRATDREKAQGAIIGKAMTGLKEGKGLVLVLVMPQ